MPRIIEDLQGFNLYSWVTTAYLLASTVMVPIYGKLSDLLPQLEGQPFFCPHKSYCVNLAFVRGINEEYQCYEMADGKNVPISRPNRSKARRAYEDFLFARTRGEK